MNWSETGDGGKSMSDILISQLSPWKLELNLVEDLLKELHIILRK